MSVDLAKLRGNWDQTKQIYTISQYVRINKVDAQRQNQPVLELIDCSINFVNKLKKIFADKSIRYKGPLSYVPSKILKTSLLSSQSPEQKFRGFINLACLLLVALNIRNIIDNLMVYGIRLTSIPFQIEKFSIIGILLFLVVNIIGMYLAVSRMFKYGHFLIKHKKQGIIITFFFVLSIIIGCGLFCYIIQPDPIIGMFSSTLSMTLSLKLISFGHVMHQVHKIRMKIKDEKNIRSHFGENDISSDNIRIIQQMSNVVPFTLKELIYFIVAPTLCYQLSYPRSNKIRWIWLAKRIIQLNIITVLQIICVLQYIIPQLQQWFQLIRSQMPLSNIIAMRLLKLAIPNLLFWISGFYSFFHLWMNILAQILMFGDREFYGDWWNCTNMEEYWKTWNLPVHFWFIRHVYNPILKAGFSKAVAGFTVFLVSAFAHQYLVSVPLRVLTYWAFIAMMMQVPFIYIQKLIEYIFKLQKSQIGNISFWISFCFLGQPLVLFIYYYLYTVTQVKHHSI